MQKLESHPTLAVGSEWDLQSVSPLLLPLMLSLPCYDTTSALVWHWYRDQRHDTINTGIHWWKKTWKCGRKLPVRKLLQAIGTKNTTLSDRKIQSRLELCLSIMILHICSPSNWKFRSDESCFPIFVDWSAVSLVVHENIFDRLLFALLAVIPPDFERGYKY